MRSPVGQMAVSQGTSASANYENYKWHIIYDYVCPGLCLKHSHADRGILLKGGYIIKISQITGVAVHMNVMD